MLDSAFSGGVLDSTTVTKPPVHAEMVTNLVNPKSQTYSCQRRQLRTRCLNPSRVPSDWSRAYASSVPRDTQASYLIRSWWSLFGAESLNIYRNRLLCALTVGLQQAKFKDWSKHVEPQAADWRTRVQFPPPPPITKPQPDRVGVFYWPFDFGMKTRSGFSRTTKWWDNAGAQRRRPRRGEGKARIIPAASTKQVI